MKKAKKVLSFLTAAMMLGGIALPAEPLTQLGMVLTARAANMCGEDLTWDYDLDTKTLTISGTGEMNDYDPLNNSVSAPWKWYTNSITSVEIGDGVTGIGEYAFYNCYSLTSVTIPDSVTSIGKAAFAGCHDLISVTIPDGVTNIEGWVFYDCNALPSVDIPDGVTGIGKYAFGSCESLTSVTIPDGVTSIGDHAFDTCSKMTTVTIPDTVKSLGEGAFQYCAALRSVKIPDGVKSIGDYTFQYCGSLTSVTIPNSVTKIGDYAFENCDSLTSVTIPESVTDIGFGAFAYCDDLTSVTIKNPDCLMSFSPATICNQRYYEGPYGGEQYTFTGTIYGEKDSIAQDYAKTYGYAFDTLKNAPNPAGSLGDGADGIRKKIEDAIADVRVERDRSVDVDKKRQLRKASKLMDRALEALDDIDVNSGEEDGNRKKASSGRK